MSGKLPKLRRDDEHLARVRECVAMVSSAVGVMEAHAGHDVAVFRVHLEVLEQWTSGAVTDGFFRTEFREMQRTRDIMSRAVHGHDAGVDRIDATVRTALAFAIWRTGAFINGEHDETVVIWCRMALGEVCARYGVRSSDPARSAAPTMTGDDPPRILPIPITTRGALALYARSPHFHLRLLTDHLAHETREDVLSNGAELLALLWPTSGEAVAAAVRKAAFEDDNPALLGVLMAMLEHVDPTTAEPEALPPIRAALQALAEAAGPYTATAPVLLARYAEASAPDAAPPSPTTNDECQSADPVHVPEGSSDS